MINKGKIMDIYSNKDFSKRLRILLFFAFLTSCSSVFAMEKDNSISDEKLQKSLFSSAFKNSFKKDAKAEQLHAVMEAQDLISKNRDRIFAKKDMKLALTDAEKAELQKHNDKMDKDFELANNYMNEALTGIAFKIGKDNAPLEAKDVVMRGFLGKNWKILADLNPKGYGDALKYLAIFKATEAVGNHLDKAIKNSTEEILTNTVGAALGGTGKLIGSAYRSIRNLIKGRSGMPFSSAELNLLRDSVKQTFIELEKVLSKSSIMDARSRDKIVRGEEIEVESVDPLWLGQKIGLVKQLDFWSQILKKRALYYDPSSDESIVFYASQIVDALEDINKNFVTPSKSQKEFGSSANQQAIQIRRSIIDINFGNLIKYISPRTADDKGSSKEGSLSSSLIRNGRRDNDLL